MSNGKKTPPTRSSRVPAGRLERLVRMGTMAGTVAAGALGEAARRWWAGEGASYADVVDRKYNAMVCRLGMSEKLGAMTFGRQQTSRFLDGLGMEERTYSEETARAMAQGVREVAGADFGISTTGIAGPGGGSEDKPVGTVHVAAATPTTARHRRFRFPGDRTFVRECATNYALDLLRRTLREA